MPSAQVIDLGRDQSQPRGIEAFFSKIGEHVQKKREESAIENIYGQYLEAEDDERALKEAMVGFQTNNDISPSRRLEGMEALKQMDKSILDRKKMLSTQLKQGLMSEEERGRQKDNLLKAGWPDYAAETYLDAPPGVKSTMEREHKELVDRGIRSPSETQSKAALQQDSIAPPEQLEMKKEIKQEEEWPAQLPQPKEMTKQEKVKWENDNQKNNNKELAATQVKKKGFKTNDLLIKSMKETSPFLPDGIEKMIVVDPKTGDVRPVAQLADKIPPQAQLYIKNLKQFLKGAKDFFGARVTNFDVSAFMAQLPGLLNSEQGRNLILNQMDLVNELESVYNNTLDEGLRRYSRTGNYADIVTATQNKVKGKEEELIGKINNVVRASQLMEVMKNKPEKYKDATLMQNKQTGEFKAFNKEDLDRIDMKKWRKF